MATKKITELVEIISAANDDVLPIVDISTDITNKIKVENLPISTSVQTALNGKENTIGYTTENVANKSTSVTTDQASNTKYPSVKAVYDWAVGLFATISQLATKQDTLVSGTNIKTINSTSLLGSGDISIQANPSGVSGAIQFSNGSAFASDAANLFWDDTNNRLGIGTNAPTSDVTIVRGGATPYNIANTLLQLRSNTINTEVVLLLADNSNVFSLIYSGNVNSNNQYMGIRGGSGNTIIRQYGNDNVGIGVTTTPSSRLQVRGSGSTSATTALLVQNSASSNALQIRDDRVIICAGMPTSSSGLPSGALWSDGGTIKIV